MTSYICLTSKPHFFPSGVNSELSLELLTKLTNILSCMAHDFSFTHECQPERKASCLKKGRGMSYVFLIWFYVSMNISVDLWQLCAQMFPTAVQKESVKATICRKKVVYASSSLIRSSSLLVPRVIEYEP